MSSPAFTRLLPAAALLAVLALPACSRTTPADGQPAPGEPISLTANDDVLNRAQIDAIGASRMTELFEGRFAGVQVESARGGPVLSIRGRRDPLIVIDGVPQGDSRSVWSLRPGDVQEIRILRDAETVSYGSRAARGVVEITTRTR